jgi:twitching motility protein PilT
MKNNIKGVIDHHTSDLHFCVRAKPMARIHGKLSTISEDIILEETFNTLIKELGMKNHHDLESDGSMYLEALDQRCRFNLYQQQHGPAIALRLIPKKIPTLDELKLPEHVKKFCALNKGLIIASGATGSGKSSTLAAMIQHINHTQAKHIITIEDPIEFIHEPELSLINQREIKSHTESFHSALRAALRQDPDIILIGEMRDLETIRLALTAAETGHLVLATLHSNSAPEVIDRIINVFPGAEQNTIRMVLSECLAGVMTQELIIQEQGPQKLAMEILVSTPAIKNMIREGKTAQITSAMQMGSGVGMKTIRYASYPNK